MTAAAASREVTARTEPARGWSALWIGFLLVATGVLILGSMDLLGDTFWSIASGRFILEHGRLPVVDPFAFTTRGETWVVHMPLCQVLFSLVCDGPAWLLGHGVSGPATPAPATHAWALVGFATAIEVGAVALLFLPYAKTWTTRTIGWALALVFVAVQRDDLCVRGQVFGDLAFALLLLLILRIRDQRRVRPIWPLVLGALWINLHASFFLGIAVPFTFAVFAAFEDRAQAKALLRLGAGVALGSLANPYFLRLHLDLAKLFAGRTTAQIDLFGPPTLTGWTIVAFVLVVGVAFLLLRQPRSAAEGIVLLLLMVAAAGGRRYVPLMVAMAVPLALRALPSVESRLGALVAGLPAAATAIAIGLGARGAPYANVPVETAAVVESEALPDNVLNPYHWGGYLDFAWHERRRVFIDGRNQLFANGTWDAETRVSRLDDVEDTLSAYRINTIIWERGAPLDRALRTSSKWRLVREGRIDVVFTRRAPLHLGPVPVL